MNILFNILKIISWLWIVIVSIFGFILFTLEPGNSEFLIPIVISFVSLNCIPVAFLIWRFKKDKELKPQREKDKLEKEKVKLEKEKDKLEKEVELDKIDNEVELKGNNKIYRFGNQRIAMSATVIIENDKWISISQKGVLNTINKGFKADRKIFIKNITGVEIKEANNITSGYIQIGTVGSNDNKGGIISSVKDQNTIHFQKENNILANKLAKDIELLIENLSSNETGTQQVTQTTTVQQLKEFKELLDDGIITQEEFDKKKAELLK